MARRGVLNLTNRQEVYLRGVCRGLTRRTVAHESYVSLYAVKATLNTVYRQLGVNDVASACQMLGAADQQRTTDTTALEPFSLEELSVIDESLRWSKYHIGNGGDTPESKKQRIAAIETIRQKVRQMRRTLKGKT